MKAKCRLILTLFLVLVVQFSFAQEKTVSGTVTAESDGLPLPGVNIIVRGTSKGVQTDFDGNYSITADEGETLVFSYVGLKSMEVTVGASNTIDVALETDNTLDEVVVVAYGTSSKEAITGAVHQIKTAEIEKRPLANLSTVIEGSTPGILVTSQDGQPGSGQAVRIRGFGSFTSSTAPLYVLDGIPINGDLNSINANDIESISILKDASSTALYGNKAANGVILITTKRGKTEVGEFRVNVSTGVVARGIKEYDRLDPFDYYEAFWESKRNALAVPGVATDAQLAAANTASSTGIINDLRNNPFNVPNDQIVGVDGKINPAASLLYPDDLDWEEAISRIGIRTNAELSFQQKSEKGDFFASMGYLDEEGYIIDSDFTRVTARVNANFQATSWIKLGVNLAGRVSEADQAQTAGSTSFVNPFRFTRGIGPIYPVFVHDASGAYVLDDNGDRIYSINDNRPSNASGGRHILAEINLDTDIRQNNNLISRSYAELKLTEDLTFTTNLSYETENFYRSQSRNTLVGDGAPAGDAFKNYIRTNTLGFNQLLNYHKSFNDIHNMEVLLGHETQKLEIDNLSASKDQQIFDGNPELGNYVIINDASSQYDERNEESFFARLNYNFDNKYYLSLSGRRDGTSVFSTDTRWGNFYSAGVSWSIDREKFIENISWIDHLKLRASFGEIGNNSIGTYYGYQGLLDLGYNNQAEAGVVVGSKASPNLLWETTQASDIALEFGLFDRLRVVAEWYDKTSVDLIFGVPLPLSAGGTIYGDQQLQNIGEIFNRGLEFSVSYDIFKNENFNWTTTINASTIKNELTSLPQEEIFNGTKKLIVGKGLFDYWIRDWYGVDPADGSGLFVAEDETATGVRTIDGVAVTPFSNNAKFHYAGTVLPDLFGSISNEFRYKEFSLGFLFTYQIGGKNLDLNYAGLMNSGTYGGALHVDILNRWKQPGDITDVPRNDAVLATQWNATSDRWLHDASYLTLRQINLAYNMPDRYANLIGMSSFQIYANAENVFNINKRKGFSQQQAFSGNTANVYEPSRIMTLGLNLKF